MRYSTHLLPGFPSPACKPDPCQLTVGRGGRLDCGMSSNIFRSGVKKLCLLFTSNAARHCHRHTLQRAQRSFQQGSDTITALHLPSGVYINYSALHQPGKRFSPSAPDSQTTQSQCQAGRKPRPGNLPVCNPALLCAVPLNLSGRGNQGYTRRERTSEATPEAVG